MCIVGVLIKFVIWDLHSVVDEDFNFQRNEAVLKLCYFIVFVTVTSQHGLISQHELFPSIVNQPQK